MEILVSSPFETNPYARSCAHDIMAFRPSAAGDSQHRCQVVPTGFELPFGILYDIQIGGASSLSGAEQYIRFSRYDRRMMGASIQKSGVITDTSMKTPYPDRLLLIIRHGFQYSLSSAFHAEL
ncbi:hypothetical protein GR212_33620 [Rhizobium lusitanum]|uniref:Uncharacterized protein n=1 Tax=Rhizobium lusitanum TaxID=293958 RepID=A0A6L9UGJ7_9HYPH|nr:hypothetical protein [Rhizobium lusitanum]NEI74489.1 hypothetical protein [Rhizobium lusitanum]